MDAGFPALEVPRASCFRSQLQVCLDSTPLNQKLGQRLYNETAALRVHGASSCKLGLVLLHGRATSKRYCKFVLARPPLGFG